MPYKNSRILCQRLGRSPDGTESFFIDRLYYTEINYLKSLPRCTVNPQYILVIAVIIIMGWFAFGVLYNLRRGDRLLKWMQAGLPGIGQKTTFRWLGTSVAELVIARAKKPFRRLETLLVFRPRDVFWMAILAYFQGRSDIVIFRAHLATTPVADLD